MTNAFDPSHRELLLPSRPTHRSFVRHLYKFHERYTHHFPLTILTGGPKLPEDFRFEDSYENDLRDFMKYSVRAETEEFPFFVTKMSPYYNR
jgi:hypothetical protein